jgi:hypothetical protein
VPDPSIKALLAASSVAFAGTVETARASDVPGVEPDERTIVVRVDQLLRAPSGIRFPPGSRVTVQLSPELPPLDEGESATFFANGWVYGDNLAVTEVGRAGAGEAGASERMAGLDTLVSPVEAAVAELAEDEVVEHAREADAVVRGHVVALAAAPKEGPPHEHDPDWWVATLEVDVVARGELPEPSTRILYANSLDVRWHDSPKPKAGQAGLWLLHRARDELAELAPFELLHAIDLQPSLLLDVLRERGLAPDARDDDEGGAGA